MTFVSSYRIPSPVVYFAEKVERFLSIYLNTSAIVSLLLRALYDKKKPFCGSEQLELMNGKQVMMKMISTNVLRYWAIYIKRLIIQSII